MPASLWRNYRTTIIVSLLALLAYANPALTQSLQLDFSAVTSGQWWRIWTGHLTHYDGQHLFWDLLMFAVLGAACERQHPRLFAAAIALMIAGISTAIGFVCEDVSVYRGLSSLDTALFVWFITDQVRQSILGRDPVAAFLWLAPGVGLIGKLLYEATTGQTLFVDATNFTPLVESHLAGVVMGLLCGVAVCVTTDLASVPVIAPARPNSVRGNHLINKETLRQHPRFAEDVRFKGFSVAPRRDVKPGL
jgi:rhomboid family GlyGly-CTERM serine protease